MTVEGTTRSNNVVLEGTVGSLRNGEHPRRLRLMMLGCEDNPPYGPTEHTAALFMDLICKSLQELTSECWTVSIVIYRVQKFEYPTTQQEWDSFDGILLPGSFSAAFDKEAWIVKLRQVILEQVHGRPTLGICFGHQVMAHAFDDGKAIKCPAGAQAGRKSFTLSTEGSSLFGGGDDSSSSKENVDLYYTHGDMVQQLPSCAVSLGGNETVPIEAAVYYRTAEEAACPTTARPIAITFQAHPEYASPELGLHKTLGSILCAMEERGDFSTNEREELSKDAIDSYATVERDSINVMKKVGILLGWFPNE